MLEAWKAVMKLKVVLKRDTHLIYTVNIVPIEEAHTIIVNRFNWVFPL